MLSKEVQVNFNLKKGSLPVRGDVDLAAANDCMKKGLAILAGGNILPDSNQTPCYDKPHSGGHTNALFVLTLPLSQLKVIQVLQVALSHNPRKFISRTLDQELSMHIISAFMSQYVTYLFVSCIFFKPLVTHAEFAPLLAQTTY